MSKPLKIISIVGFLIAGTGVLLKILYEMGYGVNLSEGYNTFEQSLSSFILIKTEIFKTLMWREVYLSLFFVICSNLILLFLKKNLKIYTLLSLGIPMSIFVFLMVWGSTYLPILTMSIIFLTVVFATIYLLLFKLKAKSHNVLLINCLYIFIYINWIEIINLFEVVSYRNPLLSSYYRIKSSDVIRYNIENWFNFRAIGYFISNIGILVVVLSILLLITCGERGKRQVG